MAVKAEQIAAHDISNADWDTPFRGSPSSDTGEFSRLGANAMVADLGAKTFSESTRKIDGSVEA